MNWKNTWLLVGLAAALFAFIYLYEQHLTTDADSAVVSPLLQDFKSSAITGFQMRRGTQFLIALERENGTWQFTKPFPYPAADLAIQNFLDAVEKIVPATFISAQEIAARKQTMADFGLDGPPVVMSLQKGAERPQEIKFGARTSANDQVYVEVVGTPGIYVVSAEILDRLPRTQYDWRNTDLFHFADQKVDRCEVLRAGAAGFALQRDATNKLWRLTRPSHRADQIAVEQFLRKMFQARVVEFVSDEPGADLDPYGLQTPEIEVVLSYGASTQRVQFGKSPTNDPSRVYGRRLAETNIVLVSKAVLDVMAIPLTDLRDHQLISFAPDVVDTVEVRGDESFILRKQPSGAWLAGEMPVDTTFVANWLAELSHLQVSAFVKDIVTDFAAYGLDPSQRQYLLKTTITNALGPTNVPINQLEFGTNLDAGVAYARRRDEDSVYGVRLSDFSRMPGAAWQLRDHRIWNFTTNQVARVLIRQGGRTRELVRQANSEWTLGKGSTGEPNPFAVEEMMFQLGNLYSLAWVARGEQAREKFGFTAEGYQITIELKTGDKPQLLTVEFGTVKSPMLLPYAATLIDGQPWIFEFPPILYGDVQRYLSVSPLTGAIGPAMNHEAHLPRAETASSF